MKSNIALSYIAMLTVVGFFLWVIRNFTRGLRQKTQLVPAPSFIDSPLDVDKQCVDWPLHIFLARTDDIPIPGRMVSISPAYAYMESCAALKTGQEISLYVEVSAKEQLRLTAKVIWARESRAGRNAAQLVFENLSADKKKELFLYAMSATD